jgi:hypothetical protein
MPEDGKLTHGIEEEALRQAEIEIMKTLYNDNEINVEITNVNDLKKQMKLLIMRVNVRKS